MSTDTRAARASRAEAATTPVLRCRDLGVAYGDMNVLHDIDLEVSAGELVALLGTSGSGKSTLLHAVAGLVELSDGEIWLGDRLVANRRHAVPAEDRAVGLVFQHFALWPHMSVIDTVAYPLRRSGSSRSNARVQAHDLLDRLGIGHVAQQRPAQLSGGEQQRVGLARALARNARLYLLDEPTAHLDTHLRAAFQESVLARRAETGASVIYSTHDAAEALAVADRVALVENGRIVQIGSPATVYSEPVSAGAAALTGPGSVLRAAVASVDADTLSVDLGSGSIAVRGRAVGDSHPRQTTVLVRPDWVTEGGPLRARVSAVAFGGPHTDYRLESAGQVLWLRLPGPPRHDVGAAVTFALRRVCVFTDAQPSATIAPG